MGIDINQTKIFTIWFRDTQMLLVEDKEGLMYYKKDKGGM